MTCHLRLLVPDCGAKAEPVITEHITPLASPPGQGVGLLGNDALQSGGFLD